MNRKIERLKFIGSLLCAAFGDAYGEARGHGAYLRYTDDTAMMIGVIEVLLADEEIDPVKLAYRFVDNYEKEPWRGYGPGPPRIFRLVKQGKGPLGLDRLLYSGGSFGNGCAMRVAPVALFYHQVEASELKRRVASCCSPTHNHPLGIEGAYIQAKAVVLAFNTPVEQRNDPYEFVENLLNEVESIEFRHKLRSIIKLLDRNPSHREVVKTLGNGVAAYNSVPTAIYSYLTNQEPMQTIQYAARLDGDRDTIACMAGAIAGAHKTHKSHEKEILGRLEKSKYIQELADRLWRLHSRIHA